MFANASKHVVKFIFSYTCQNMTFPWHYFRQCVSKHAVKLTLHWFSKQLSRISMARSSKCLKGNFWAHFCLCPQPNPQIKKKGNELFRFSKFSTSPLRRKAQWGARVFSPSFQRAPIVFETEGVSPRRFFSSPPMAPMVKSFRAFFFSSRLVGAPPLGSTESPDSSANSVVGLFQGSKRRDPSIHVYPHIWPVYPHIPT